MKKAFSIIMVFVLMMQMVAVCGTASAVDTAALVASDAEGVVGDKVEVTVAIANNTTGFGGLEFTVNFDKDVLTLTEIEFSDAVGDLICISGDSEEANASGAIKITAVGIENKIGDMDIVTLSFEIKSETSIVSPITITEYEASYAIEGEADLVDISLNTTSGKVTVNEKPAYMMGDVTGDGRVNMADAIAIRRYMLDPVKYPLTIADAADVTGDNKINMADAIAIRRYMLDPEKYPFANK